MSNETTAPRLTSPQRGLLQEAHQAGGKRTIDRGYKPALRLVELGYATFESQRFGGSRLVLTEAGQSRATIEAAHNAA